VDQLDSIRPLAGRRSDNHAEPSAVVPIDVDGPEVVNRRDRPFGADPKPAVGVGLTEAEKANPVALCVVAHDPSSGSGLSERSISPIASSRRVNSSRLFTGPRTSRRSRVDPSTQRPDSLAVDLQMRIQRPAAVAVQFDQRDLELAVPADRSLPRVVADHELAGLGNRDLPGVALAVVVVEVQRLLRAAEQAVTPKARDLWLVYT